MKKILQNMMYIASFVLVLAIIVALVRAGSRTVQPQGMQQSAEEESETLETEQPHIQDSQIEHLSEEDSNLGIKETETADEKVNVTEDTTVIFTGDVLFANAFQVGYDANGIEGVIEEDLLKELQKADILMVNQEFPFSERGTAMNDKQYTFRCNPNYVTALKEMGVDIVSLANNHVLDYGKDALRDTFAALDETGILYGGAGESKERAKEVQIIEVNGKKYGFIAVSRVVPTGDWKVENSAPGVFSCYDDADLIKLVEQASDECDFLAVYPHWGVEYQAYPEDYQRTIAERVLAAGADVVVGSHTHCLQGVEYMGDKPVFYSMGNFVFGQKIDSSAILKVTISADGNLSYQYLPIFAEGGVTRLAAGDKAEQTYAHLRQISQGTVITEKGIISKKN